MNARGAALVVLVLALSVPLTGCQKVVSAFTPKPEVVTREATAAASGAEVVGSIPADFPSDLPLWPGAKVADAIADGPSKTLVLKMNESYEDVVAGIAVGFERAGWSAVKVAEEASATVLEVRGEGQDGIVTIYGGEEGTSVEYLLTEPSSDAETAEQ